MLYDTFNELEQSAIGEAIRNSLWLFPVIEAFHLVGLALLGGAILIMDLRLIGIGFRSQPIRVVFKSTRPIFYLALVLMFATGIPLALSEMIKLYYNFSFWVKASALITAIVFTFVLKHPLINKDTLPRSATILLGLTSLVLWFTVAGAGRWIGFS